MGRRRKTELGILLEALPLPEQVQAQAAGVTFTGQQRRAPRDDEGKTRNAFETFVRRGDQEVDARLRKVNGHRAERAHRIDDKRALMPARDLPQRRDGIEDAGRRLAVNGRNVRHGGILHQQTIQGGGIVRRVLRCAQDDMIDARQPQHLHHAFAIGTIGHHRHLALRRHTGGKDRFHAERPAALQKNCFIPGFPRQTGHRQQLLADMVDDRVEFVVPRSRIVQHGLLDRQAGRQRAGREEQLVVSSGKGVFRFHNLVIEEFRRVLHA